MIFDIQKASILKRFSAFLLDFILLAVFAAGGMWAISAVTGYENYSKGYDDAQQHYEEQFDIKFDEYDNQSEEYKERYEQAYNALTADTTAMKDYSMTVNLLFVMISLGLFLSYMIVEFLPCIIFGNGQTVGKRVFSICVVRPNGVKASGVIIFVRTILGKYTIETMVPLMLTVMFFFNIVHPFIAIAGALGIFVGEIIMFIGSKRRQFLHDSLAVTVVADKSTQMIFESEDALIEYSKKRHNEMAERAEY